MSRPLNKIAADILADWGPPGKNQPAYIIWCKPYVAAMLSLKSIEDTYGLDPADDIVVRFLVNSNGWRGDVARRVKLELNQLLKEYHASPTRQ
jgi:hypothetical protein